MAKPSKRLDPVRKVVEGAGASEMLTVSAVRTLAAQHGNDPGAKPVAELLRRMAAKGELVVVQAGRRGPGNSTVYQKPRRR